MGAPAPRVAFRTLGCKLNQHESDSLAADFQAMGYTIVSFEESADVYVLNTCTVTNKADRKSRNLLYRTLRTAQPAEAQPAEADTAAENALVVLTGCFAESHKQTYAGDNRFLLVDNPRKSHLVELVEARRRGELADPEAPDPNLFKYHAASVYHTRSTIKVQDGCNNFCTFCIVPYVRGTAASRPHAEIRADVERSVEAGTREIVLTGVNMSRYKDEGLSFSAMVEKVLSVPGDFRVRISSIEPDSLDDRFFELLGHPKMSPHLHLCLQSGSDRILLKMRRQYDTNRFYDYVERIRAAQPDFNLTTDVIVGFPGESEEDFARTAEMVRDIGFSHVHTFPYSLRSRTRAARMDGHVSTRVKTERAEIIRNIAAQNKRRYRSRFIGREQTLLVERSRPGPGREHGYGEHYVPIRIEGFESSGPAHQALRAEQARPGPGPAPRPAQTEPLDEASWNEFQRVFITALSDGEEPLLVGRVAPAGGSELP